MAFMVIVNNPGSWSHIYPPLRHAPWDGCTPTDLVFPFFLFVVGVSLWLSIGRFTLICAGSFVTPVPRGFWTKFARRTVVIFALGLFLNAFPRFDLEHLRIPGVLQRISLCFTLAALLAFTHSSWRVLFSALTLTVYSGLVWLDSEGPTPEANACRSIDIALLSSDHLYRNSPTDPEGLLSTLPATVTVLLGFGIARRLFPIDEELTHAHAWRTTALGAALTLGGLILSPLIPLNKPLWSPSYVLFTAGLATAALSSISLLVNLGNARRWFAWLEVFGKNAMTLFVGSGILGRLLGFITVGEGDAKRSLSAVIYENAFVSWLGHLNGSLAYALSMLALWWIILYLMNRRGWIWRA